VQRKTFRIKKGLSEKGELDTLIHDVPQSADWHKTEEWIEAVGSDLAKIFVKDWCRKGQGSESLVGR